MSNRRNNNMGFSEDHDIVVSMPPQTMSKSKDVRTSFTADSPYYTSYVDNEMRQLGVLSETLRDVSARAKTFGKCGALMAEATRRLALACRLKPSTPIPDDDTDLSRQEREDKIVNERQESVGEEMMTVLSTLGEVLDEIADAQVQMCESLEASLSHSLEAFCGTEVHEVTQLKNEAEQMTENAENCFSKYLNGRNALSGDAPVDTWNKLSDQVSGGIGSTFSKWRAGMDGTNAHAERGGGLKNWRNKDDQSNSLRRARNKPDADPGVVVATTAANLRLTLEQIRLSQASAELKRFQLLKKLVSIKKRRNYELGESALASLHGIRAYFHHCSDLVQGLTPRMARIQSTQKDSRDKHSASQLPWEAREQGLVGAMDRVGQSVAHASSLADMIAAGELTTSPVPVSLDQLERETQIWELPTMLAESSRYQREPAPGVLVEGWLYKKSSSRMTLQQWNKRWFMMDKDGIYYFRTSAEMKKANGAGYLHTLERVKICDIVLCTVREIMNDGLRFCFEIVTPNQRPLLLQARGPLEYRMWVEGIRNSIETQLVSGTVDAATLMRGLGKPNKKKKKSEGTSETVTTLASMLEPDTVGSKDTDGDEASETVDFEFKDSDHDDGLHHASAEDDFRISLADKRQKNPLITSILEANPTCADCEMESPDWASLNLGVLVCIECSGVHRSLGVHVSKVRSLKLDSMSDAEARLLLALGNKRINRILEVGVGSQEGWKKPTPNASRKLKENWIKSKYVWKGFLEDRTGDERDQNLALYESAREGDLLGIVEALAYGGDIDWKNPNDDDKTPLHICALSKPDETGEWKGLECAEFLLQNGAKVGARDSNTQGVLDCAVIGNGEREMVEFLSARLG